MISLETAKKLKKAGLKWEAVSTDMYYKEFTSRTSKGYGFYSAHNMDISKDDIFAPRLHQLLAEITKRGKFVNLSGPYVRYGKWYCRLGGSVADPEFHGDSPEEAAAQALLWILENKDADHD